MAEPTLPAELHRAYLDLAAEKFGLRVGGHLARRLDGAVQDLLAHAAPTELDAATLLPRLRAGAEPGLLDLLAGALTVGETHFFRVAPQIEALRRLVLPDAYARRAATHTIRLWSAGCSTGEEPYTLAILLRESLPAPDWRVEFVASDLNREALDVARQATYGEWSFRETPAEVRQRWFRQAGRHWHLDAAVRDMVRFEYLNLVSDPFPVSWYGDGARDVILCRNVTIYFGSETTQRLYQRFAEVLAPGGWLVLGPSDPPPLAEPGAPFEPVFMPDALVWRRVAAAAPARVAATARRPAPPSAIPAPTASRSALPTGAPHAPGLRGRPMPTVPRATARPIPAPVHRPAPPAAGLADPRSAVPPTVAQVRDLAHAGKRREARELAEQVAQARATDPEAHLLLGMLYLDDGEAQRALASLRSATFLDQHNPLAQFSLARAYRELGDQPRARGALRQARRLLAPLPEHDPVPGGDGLAVGDLRHAVDAQLADLGPEGEA